MSTLCQQEYHRLNVFDYIDSFCGWSPLTELVKYGGSPRNETFLLCLIKTGGRAGEVLSLDRNNFELDKRKKALIVSNMKLEKRFIKVKQADGEYTRQHIEAWRKPFPIPLKEPLTTELLTRLEEYEWEPLFASPYKEGKPLTVSWGYKLIRRISNEIPPTLFNQLGLNRPLIDKQTGQKVNDIIHLWQHWFRSQRASGLRADYGFTEPELMEYFGWTSYATAQHYTRISVSQLAAKMNRKL